MPWRARPLLAHVLEEGPGSQLAWLTLVVKRGRGPLVDDEMPVYRRWKPASGDATG